VDGDIHCGGKAMSLRQPMSIGKSFHGNGVQVMKSVGG
jgi:hypothetical protein